MCYAEYVNVKNGLQGWFFPLTTWWQLPLTTEPPPPILPDQLLSLSLITCFQVLYLLNFPFLQSIVDYWIDAHFGLSLNIFTLSHLGTVSMKFSLVYVHINVSLLILMYMSPNWSFN